jgi:hypothetical protein
MGCEEMAKSLKFRPAAAKFMKKEVTTVHWIKKEFFSPSVETIKKKGGNT